MDKETYLSPVIEVFEFQAESGILNTSAKAGMFKEKSNIEDCSEESWW
jgi:hypothetical protein